MYPSPRQKSFCRRRADCVPMIEIENGVIGIFYYDYYSIVDVSFFDVTRDATFYIQFALFM